MLLLICGDAIITIRLRCYHIHKYLIMNKYILLLLLPLLSYTLIGCDDEDGVKSMDLRLFAGTWEVVRQGDQNVFKREDILHVKSSQIHEGFGGYQGYITVYFLKFDDTPLYDKVYTWSIREVENHQPLLDVVFQGELDNDDIWSGNYYYRIVKLTDTHMWWQVNANGDNSTIMLRRRNDIQIE